MPGNAVESGIKAQNSLDSMMLHDREMYTITGGQLPVGQDNLFWSIRHGPANREHFVYDSAKASACRTHSAIDRMSESV